MMSKPTHEQRTEKGAELSKQSPCASNDSDIIPGSLSTFEVWWRDHFQWLTDRGYLLRPRYSPDWVPSWKGTHKCWYTFEDGQRSNVTCMDAIRISDGSQVMLKLLNTSIHPYEVDIAQSFCSESLASDPANHAVPIYEVLRVPKRNDLSILVMPLLQSFEDLRFDTFGEVIAFFIQLFEGTRFIHEHYVNYRTFVSVSIMMDAKPLYDDPYHPCMPDKRQDFKGRVKHVSRTERPPKYYFTDFGRSHRSFGASDDSSEWPSRFGDVMLPESQNPHHHYDLILADVYHLGMMIRSCFINAKFGFEFMTPLVDDMLQDDPTKRPSMNEVIARFDETWRGLGTWKLRSRVVNHSDHSIPGFFRAIAHWKRRIGFIVRHVPPVPTD